MRPILISLFAIFFLLMVSFFGCNKPKIKQAKVMVSDCGNQGVGYGDSTGWNDDYAKILESKIVRISSSQEAQELSTFLHNHFNGQFLNAQVLDADYSENVVLVCALSFRGLQCGSVKKNCVRDDQKDGITEVYVKLKSDFAGRGEISYYQHISVIVPLSEVEEKAEIHVVVKPKFDPITPEGKDEFVFTE